MVSSSLLLGTVWCCYAAVTGQRYRISWLEGFLAAGLAIVWFQTVPQTAEQMLQFSGEYTRLLPAWNLSQDAGSDVHWKTLSLTPVETQHAFRMFLAYGIVTLVMFQRIRTQTDCHRILKSVAVSGVAMTAFGLLQWAASNGRFFWFYEHPFTDPDDHLKGAFTNRNHFAQFLALSLGPLLWWLFDNVRRMLEVARNPAPALPAAVHQPASPKRRSRRRRSAAKSIGGQFALPSGSRDGMLTVPVLILVVCVAVVSVSVMLTLSRGGMIAGASAVLVALVGLWRGFNRGGALAAILLGGSAMFLTLLAFGNQEQIQSRVDQLISSDANQVDEGGARRAIWTADAKAIQKFPLLGTGVGSHREIYATYMEDYADYASAEMTHAESSYIHLALETGLIGAGTLLLAICWILLRLVRGYLRTESDARKSIAVAVAASGSAALLHAVTDFIWYVPAIVILTLMLVVVGLKAVSGGMDQPHQNSGLWIPRAAWAALAGLCVLEIIQVQPSLLNRVHAEHHFFAGLRLRPEVAPDDDDGFANLQADDTLDLALFQDPIEQETQAQYSPERLARERDAQISYHRQCIGHLVRAVKADGSQHRIQLSMAEHLVKLFDLLQMNSETQMPLNMVRDAAIASEFRDAAEMHEWLNRACGSHARLLLLANHLARQSLSLCPVQGYAYLALVETAFVRDPQDRQHQQFIDQAVVVRGHDPRISFVAGREALMAGDREAAMAFWNSVFHSSQQFRLTIVMNLAPTSPVEFFIQQFSPNAEELKDLMRVYEALDRPRDTNVVLASFCEVIPEEAPLIEDEDERLAELMLACNAAHQLEKPELCLKLLAATLEEFPESYDARYLLGSLCLNLNAMRNVNLTWCGAMSGTPAMNGCLI
ncbi:MAG: O-antigen ligase family protein [Planctomycetaceae bacterium]